MEELLTVKETSKILKTNTNYVYKLIKGGYIKCLKLGNYKIRTSALKEFLDKYEGKDLTDLDNVKELWGRWRVSDRDNISNNIICWSGIHVRENRGGRVNARSWFMHKRDLVIRCKSWT